MPFVKFYPGDGTHESIDVSYIGAYAMNERGQCAYCNGDPGADSSGPDSRIAQYYKRNPHAVGCPLCRGE
jgi:hypothetical protein